MVEAKWLESKVSSYHPRKHLLQEKNKRIKQDKHVTVHTSWREKR